MKILIDAYGGDKGALEIIKASRMASDELGHDICIIGDEKDIKEKAETNDISLNNIEINNTSDFITMNEDPMEIMKSKKESTMAKGLKLLADGNGDAFVSSGNSGALAVGTTLIVKRIKKVKRCAFAPIVPTKNGCFMLLDSGANLECRPEMLYQFGVLGSIYMKNIMVTKNPKVGLVNVGVEKCKGGELLSETYELLIKNDNINFIGNIEARDIPSGISDVVVTDGFTGNVILKLYEGMASEIFGNFKDILTKNFKNKIAGKILSQDLKAFKNKIDYKKYGGAPLLGASCPVFKAHGNSDSFAFKNAIRLAGEYAKRGVIKIMSDAISEENKNETK